MLEPVLVVRGRQVYPEDLRAVREAVEAHRHEGTDAIALALCKQWVWRQCGGSYNIRGAERVLFAAAHRGLVELPPRRGQIKHVAAREPGPEPGIDTSPIEGHLSDVLPVELILVNEGEKSAVFQYLMARYHYLGSRRVIGQHLKYIAIAGGRPVAALLWGRASLKLRARDEIIGWSAEERRAGIERVANNYRFLVLPWVRVPHLASHVLAANVRRLPDDWERSFGCELEYLESFVDPERFSATAYLAANWVCVGETSGSGRCGPRYHYHGHRKKVLLYALRRATHAQWLQCGLKDPTTRETPHTHSRLHVVLPDKCDVEGDAGTVAEIDFYEGLTGRDVKTLASELSEYCAKFYDLFPRSELQGHFAQTISGLMSPLEKKNVEFIALRGGTEVPVRTLQHFLTGSRWDDEAVRIRHQEFVAATMSHPEGLYIVDESGFPKKGQNSAGVARQYCGALGKVDNCQVGVYLTYATPDGTAAIVDTSLYMPQGWFTAEQKAERWEDCHIPEDLEFRTKPKLALELIQSVFARKVLPAQWVLADSVYGDNAAFLDGLPNELRYFCQVSSTSGVWLLPGPDTTESADEGPRPVPLRDIPERLSLTWQTNVILKQGTQGPIFADVACCRVVELRHDAEGKPGRGNEVWLFLRRLPETGEVKYYLSSAPAETPLEKLNWLSCMRWPIETCFQQGKDHLGMDHYQVRTWRAWHRHMTLVMLAHHFLLTVRRKLKKNS